MASNVCSGSGILSHTVTAAPPVCGIQPGIEQVLKKYLLTEFFHSTLYKFLLLYLSHLIVRMYLLAGLSTGLPAP